MSHSQFEHIGGVLLKQNIPIYILDLSNKPIVSSLLVSSDYIGRKAFIFRSMGFHPPCLRSEQVLEFLSADVPRVAHVRRSTLRRERISATLFTRFSLLVLVRYV